jgi:hypothetical protein
MILANASAVGMEPNPDQTPVSKVLSLSLSLSILVRTQNILINVLPHFMLI